MKYSQDAAKKLIPLIQASTCLAPRTEPDHDMRSTAAHGHKLNGISGPLSRLGKGYPMVPYHVSCALTFFKGFKGI